MLNVLIFLLAVVVETILYCTIPLLIRTFKREPLKNKTAWYLSTINFGLIFTILRLVESKLFNLDFNLINPGLLSGILSIINVYILKYDKYIHKTFFESLKEDYKKILKTLFIVSSVLLVISLAVYLIIGIIKNKINDNLNNIIDNTSNTTNNTNSAIDNFVIKSINSQKEFNNAISSTDYSIVVFGYDGCVYCDLALPILKDLTKELKLTKIYYYNVSNGNINTGIELEEFPVVAIYKKNEFVAKKVGYEELYRKEIIELLENNNVI